MSPESVAKERPLAFDDPALHPGWKLLEYLLSIGADEFAISILEGEGGEREGDWIESRLMSASIGLRVRECAVTYGNDANPRPIEVWRLDTQSLEALREIMPAGIIDQVSAKSCIEDLCVYRHGELLFGTVTHEEHAFFHLADAEWELWQSRVASP
jgi:hypothetical protein